MLVCGMGLMLWNVYIEPYRRQRQVLAEIEELGGGARTEAVPTKWGQWLFGDEFFLDVVSVELTNTKVDDAWMVRLRHLPRLRYLIVGGTDVGDDGLAPVAHLRDLRQLVVYGPKITDAGVAHLAGLTQLESLFLDGTGVTDAGLAHLRDHTQMQSLHLRGGNITDAGMVHLARMTELWRLWLSDTHVSDVGIARLAGLEKLTELHLQNTEVTEASLEHFRRLPALDTLSLAGTHIIPSALREALPQLADRRARQELGNRSDLRFVHVALSDVVDYLQDFHQIEIVLDAGSLAPKGLNTPLTSNIEGKSLEATLAEVLPPLGLKAKVRYGILLISGEAAESPSLRRLALGPGQRLRREFSRALYARIALNYAEVPLEDVLDDLAMRHGVPCRMDGDGWRAETRQKKVTCNLYGGCTANTLELLLDQLDLHGIIEDNSVLVRPGRLPE
jgi:hypothetical protein